MESVEKFLKFRMEIARKLCENKDILVKKEGHVGIKLCLPVISECSETVSTGIPKKDIGIIVSTYNNLIQHSGDAGLISVGNWVKFKRKDVKIDRFEHLEGGGYFLTVRAIDLERVDGHEITKEPIVVDFEAYRQISRSKRNSYVF